MNAIPATRRSKCRWRQSATRIGRWRKQPPRGSHANVGPSTRTPAVVHAAGAVADAAAQRIPAQRRKSKAVSDAGDSYRMTIRWGRIVIGAVLLEAALVAIAVPLLAFMDNPFAPGAAGTSGDYTIFFVTVAIACFVVGGLLGAWVARPLTSGVALHGALTGIVATAIYLAICSIPPTTIPAVVAAYGPLWFLLANGLRVAGATMGAVYLGRRR